MGNNTMRHVILTCKNHDQLRWTCKEIAFSDAGGYNESRNIFYQGDKSECSCPSRDLVRAPEDADELVKIKIDGAWTGVRQDSDILARYDAACTVYKIQYDARRSLIFKSGASIKERSKAIRDLHITMPFSFAG